MDKKEFYSQRGEDKWIFENLTPLPENGVFVDIGCNHPINNNNTYAFERYLGWSGTGVDINFAHAESWAQHRPKSAFIAGAISLSSSSIIPIKPDFRNNGELLRKESGVNTFCATISVSTFQAIIKEVTLLSIDVEGMEKIILERVFQTERPKILIVEHSTLGIPFDENLLPFIVSNGYTLRHTTEFNYILTL